MWMSVSNISCVLLSFHATFDLVAERMVFQTCHVQDSCWYRCHSWVERAKTSQSSLSRTLNKDSFCKPSHTFHISPSRTLVWKLNKTSPSCPAVFLTLSIYRNQHKPPRYPMSTFRSKIIIFKNINSEHCVIPFPETFWDACPVNIPQASDSVFKQRNHFSSCYPLPAFISSSRLPPPLPIHSPALNSSSVVMSRLRLITSKGSTSSDLVPVRPSTHVWQTLQPADDCE